MVFNPFKVPEDEEDQTNRGVAVSSKPISDEIIRRFGKMFAFIFLFFDLFLVSLKVFL